MLSREDNELITRVGPGTPGGTLLRMYWHPISLSREINDESPTKFVRVLGEDLVIFKDKSGRFGLIADKCAHRSASMVYGRVEERGISCVYHGWLYDCEGNIIETPPERNDSIMKNVKTTAYPVEDYLGMIWAYMGPQPAPPMTHYDTLFRKDGKRKWLMHPNLNANWFQAMENSMDPAHLQVLHQEFIGKGKTPVSTTRGFTDDVESFDFYVTEYGGLMKHRRYINGMEDAHPVLFPNILRQGASSQFRVPIDDTHTMHHRIFFYPTEDGSEPEDAFDPEITFEKPIKEDPTKNHPETKFILHSVNSQDQMAWETQGPITDRTIEHLSYSDRGVVLLRRHTKEMIERVQRGEDPIGYQRDPNHAIIDTNVDDGVWQISQQRTGLGSSALPDNEAAKG
jgi:5,5'-dehydrodivanillate O-demethylase oxygenase subunit